MKRVVGGNSPSVLAVGIAVSAAEAQKKKKGGKKAEAAAPDQRKDRRVAWAT